MNEGMSLTLPHIIRLGDVALRILSGLGVREITENRVARSLRVLRHHHASGPTSHASEMRELVSAEQNVLEAFFIASAANQAPESVVLAKLETVLRGQVDQASDALSHVRDTQFELVVWALAKLMGEGPAELAEPDVFMRAFGGTVGVAAKRLSSRRSLARHLKKGADQVRRAKPDLGVLAVNVDAVLPIADGDVRPYVTELPQRIEQELDRVRPGHKVGAIFVLGASFSRDAEGFPTLDYDAATRLIRVKIEAKVRVEDVFGALGVRLRSRLWSLVQAAG